MLSKPPTTSFSSSSWSYSGSSSSSTHRAKTKGNSADTELEYSHPAPVSAFDGNQSVRQSPSPPPLSSRPPIPSPSARGSIASPTEAYPTSSRLEEDVTTATPPPQTYPPHHTSNLQLPISSSNLGVRIDGLQEEGRRRPDIENGLLPYSAEGATDNGGVTRRMLAVIAALLDSKWSL